MGLPGKDKEILDQPSNWSAAPVVDGKVGSFVSLTNGEALEMLSIPVEGDAS